MTLTMLIEKQEYITRNSNTALYNKKNKSFCFLRLTLYICIVVYAIIVSCPNKDNKNKTGETNSSQALFF